MTLCLVPSLEIPMSVLFSSEAPVFSFHCALTQSVILRDGFDFLHIKGSCDISFGSATCFPTGKLVNKKREKFQGQRDSDEGTEFQ